MSAKGLYPLVALAVCASGAGPAALLGQGVSVRDSAGVRIVENGRVDDLPVALRIATEPVLDLGGDRGDPEREFDSKAPLVTAARLSDGRWVAVDFARLKLFDADGRFLKNVGGPGDGPGEFKQVGSMCVAPGDTLVASNLYQAKVSVFDGQGRHVRTFTDRGRHFFVPQSCFSDGTFLLGASLPMDLEHDVFRFTELRRMDPGGVDLGVVDTLRSGYMNPFFETVASYVVHEDEIYAGDGTAPEYRVYDAAGKLMRIVRWQAEAIVPTRKMLEEQVESHLPRNAPESQREYALGRARSMPVPPRLPVYFYLRVDGRGRVWVEAPPLSAGFRSHWTVFDASGAVLGRVTLPDIPGARSLDLRALGRDTVTLWWKDEALGFGHLTFHRLEPVRGG